VAGVGEQVLVRTQQRLDLGGGAVETAGQGGHLVGAAGIDTVRQIAVTKAFHAALQAFETPRQPPHHRVGAQRHTQKQQDQKDRQRLATGARTKNRQAPHRVVAALHHADTSIAGMNVCTRSSTRPRALSTRKTGRRQALHTDQAQRSPVRQRHLHAAHTGVVLALFIQVRGGDSLALCIGQRNRHAQALAPLLQRSGLLHAWRGRRRQGTMDQHRNGHQSFARDAVGGAPFMLHLALKQPGRAKRKRQQQHHQRQIDAQVKRTHRAQLLSASCLRANT